MHILLQHIVRSCIEKGQQCQINFRQTDKIAFLPSVKRQVFCVGIDWRWTSIRLGTATQFSQQVGSGRVNGHKRTDEGNFQDDFNRFPGQREPVWWMRVDSNSALQVNFGVQWFQTDLKRIQTPHTGTQFISGLQSRQKLYNLLVRAVRQQSSSLSPSLPLPQAACHLAITPEDYSKV